MASAAVVAPSSVDLLLPAPILSLLIILALLAHLQFRLQIARAGDNITAEVLAADALVHAAAQATDEELFRTFLSGRDPSWAAEQTRLVSEGLAMEQAARVLGLQPLPGGRTIAEIELSPQLGEARLSNYQTYLAPTPGSHH